MSTKAELEAIRDANWGDTAPASPSTPLRDPVCDRTVFDALIAELYSSEKQEVTGGGSGAGSNTIVNGTMPISGTSYNLFFKKIGNEVILQGYFQNLSGSSVAGNATIFNLFNTQYRLKSGSYGIIAGSNSLGSSQVYMTAGSNAFKCATPIPNGTSFIFNGRYTCED